jgi:2-oxoglutarate dehydrogenase E1 component
MNGAGFRPVIGDSGVEPSSVTRVVLCSGKISWELEAERKRREGDAPQTAIVRVEQLYPLPAEEIKAELARYPGAEVLWVQDEPENQGPWPFLTLKLAPQLDRPVKLISRESSPTPSVGSSKVHAAEQASILSRTFE